MTNILRYIEHVWDALTHLSSADKVTLLVAVLALLVSVWSAVISKRSAKATERSAKATELQAKATEEQANYAAQQASAAFNQADAAFAQAHAAARFAEAEMLEAARTRINAAAPNVAIALTHINKIPGLAKNAYELPAPLQTMPVEEKRELSHWDHWHYDVFFVILGTVYNSGSEAIRITPSGPVFYPGKHPMTSEDVAIPQLAHPSQPTYILYPGQLAHFQILASKQADDWLNLSLAKGESHVRYPVALFVCQPGAADDPMMVIRVKTEAEPVVESKAQGEGAWATLLAGCYVNVTVEFDRKYPTSFERIHAELTDDEDEIASLEMRDSLRREIRKLKGSDARLPMVEIVQLQELRERLAEEPPAPE